MRNFFLNFKARRTIRAPNHKSVGRRFSLAQLLGDHRVTNLSYLDTFGTLGKDFVSAKSARAIKPKTKLAESLH